MHLAVDSYNVMQIIMMMMMIKCRGVCGTQIRRLLLSNGAINAHLLPLPCAVTLAAAAAGSVAIRVRVLPARQVVLLRHWDAVSAPEPRRLVDKAWRRHHHRWLHAADRLHLPTDVRQIRSRGSTGEVGNNRGRNSRKTVGMNSVTVTMVI